MQHISLFFNKYEEIEKSTTLEKDFVQKVIKSCTGLDNKQEKITVNNGNIKLTVTSGERSLLMEKKEELVDFLEKNLGKKIIKII